MAREVNNRAEEGTANCDSNLRSLTGMPHRICEVLIAMYVFSHYSRPARRSSTWRMPRRRRVSALACVIWCLSIASAQANFLYWSRGAIYRGPKGGGAVTTLFDIDDYPGTPDQVNPLGVAVDQDSIYWTDSATDQILHGNKDGTGSASVLYSANDYLEPSAPALMSAIAADDQFLYWIVSGAIYRGLNDGSGAVGQLFGTDSNASGGLAVDDQFVYWLDKSKGLILRGPKDGGTAEVLYGDDEYSAVSLYDLTVDDDSLYWTDIRTGELLAAPKNGSGIVSAIYETFSIRNVAVDNSRVYWTVEHTSTDDYILRAAKSGGAISTTIFVGPPGPGYLAVDPIPEPSSLVAASVMAAILLPARFRRRRDRRRDR